MKIFAYNDFILKEYEKEIYADDSHILFIKHTAEVYFDNFILGSRCVQSEKKGHYFFTLNPQKVLKFPFYASVSQFFTKPSLLFQAKKILKEEIPNNDVFWLTWPHPISFLVLAMIGRKKPVVLFVRQNLEALIEVRYQGINRFVGKLFTKFLYTYARKFHSNALVVSIGDEMYHYFKPTFKHNFLISDSVVSQKQQLPPRTMVNKNPRLLFVGRLEPEKGLFDLIKAVQLINQKTPVSLSIVGEGGLEKELKDYVESIGFADKLNFEGYKAFGEDLFELYRTHDIMAISSYSEGLPKIINEARAFAMPIVTTKVGGIAKELNDEETCLFVEAGQPSQFATAVISLIETPSLYQEISRNLHDQFNSNSLEYWSGEFAEIVKTYIEKDFKK